MTPDVPRRGPNAALQFPRASALPWLGWTVALGVVTAAMLPVRPTLDKSHVAFVYLLLILCAGASSRRGVAISLAAAAFICLNFFFVAPYHTLRVGDLLDWLVLGAFLATSLVATHLLSKARAEALVAQQRADEVERLAVVGAEALGAGRAEDALVSIAEVIGSTLEAVRCELYLRERDGKEVRLVAASAASEEAPGALSMEGRLGAEDSGALSLPTGIRLVLWVATSGRSAVQCPDGAVRVAMEPRRHRDSGFETEAFVHGDVRQVLLPLRVEERIVGVLRLAAADRLALDPPRRRFLDALTYYAALGIERVRLVSEARHADALREADVLKNAMLASVSHDLRTPLTTIKALAHAIRVDGDDRAATIEEEADRLNRFVADLLDLSRLAGGALVVHPEITALDDLLGAALQRVDGALGGRQVDVRLDTTEPLLLGRFDFPHTLRIVVNLLENAVRHDPTSSPIEITARRDGNDVEVVVMDRGPGVPAHERERIFEPFYSVDGTSAGRGGAGLGLSISRQLAEAQSGSLTWQARAGGGSRFVLRLLAVDAAELAGMRESL